MKKLSLLFFLILTYLSPVFSRDTFAFEKCLAPPSGQLLKTTPEIVKTGVDKVTFTIKSASLNSGTTYVFKVDGNTIDTPGRIFGDASAVYDTQNGMSVTDQPGSLSPNPFDGFSSSGYGVGGRTLSVIAKGSNTGCDIPFEVVPAAQGGEKCSASILTQPTDAVPNKDIIIKFGNAEQLNSTDTRRVVVKATDPRSPSFKGDQFIKVTECLASSVFTDPSGYNIESLPLGTWSIGLQEGCGPTAGNLCYTSIDITSEGTGGELGASQCQILACPAGTRPSGEVCRGLDPDLPPVPPTSKSTITCYYPLGCPVEGSQSCSIIDASRFRNSFDPGTRYRFNPCPNKNDVDSKDNCTKVRTGLPGLTLGTSAEEIGKGLLGLLITIGGAVAFILIIITGYRLMTSQGDPEKIKAAREQLTSAIVGLLFIIFSISILSFLGFDVLQIPGFGSKQ